MWKRGRVRWRFERLGGLNGTVLPLSNRAWDKDDKQVLCKLVSKKSLLIDAFPRHLL